MVVLGFKSSKDVEAPEKINCELIKAKISQLGLEKVLLPIFSQLLEHTVNTTGLTQTLLKKDVMTLRDIAQCMSHSTTFLINLEVYRAVMMQNAGEALVDALYETENFHVLQLLQSNTAEQRESSTLQLPLESDQLVQMYESSALKTIEKKSPQFLVSIDPPSKSLSHSKQVSILQSGFIVKEINASSKWMDDFGYKSWSDLGEITFDWTLARVAFAAASDADLDHNTRDSRKVFYSREFHPDEDLAVPKFLESQLCYEIEKKTMIIAPREIYLNTRSFSKVQWEWLSKLLYSFGGDRRLENLWLDQVNYEDFSRGTEWMKTLPKVKQSGLRFPELKAYTFLGSFLILDKKSLNNILLLIKSADESLDSLKKFSGCNLEVRSTSKASCYLSLHLPKGSLHYDGTSEDVSKELFRRDKSVTIILYFILCCCSYLFFLAISKAFPDENNADED